MQAQANQSGTGSQGRKRHARRLQRRRRRGVRRIAHSPGEIARRDCPETGEGCASGIAQGDDIGALGPELRELRVKLRERTPVAFDRLGLPGKSRPGAAPGTCAPVSEDQALIACWHAPP